MKKASYSRARNDVITRRQNVSLSPKTTFPRPNSGTSAKLGGTDYGTVQVVQAMETSTATGQQVPTQMVAVHETQLDPNVNTKEVVNPFGGYSSYSPKGSGTFGGL